MNVFGAVKGTVTARQVAEAYGIKVSRNGMACCPFHADRTPSMKVDERYYCFGCGVTGDAVDLAAQLLGVPVKDAALQIASDFGIDVAKSRLTTGSPYHARAEPKNNLDDWMAAAIRTVLEYRDLLRQWRTIYAPQSMDEEWHPLFCEALKYEAWIEYLLDELSLCSKEQFEEMKNCCGEEVRKIGKRLEQYAGRNDGRN